MAFSYSFHLSAKGHSVNTIGKINQVSRHNLRAYKSDDFDKSQIDILLGSDSSILDDVKRIYHNEFDEVLKNYNAGKRPDRKIKDYLEHISNSRSDVACELILQIGDMDFWNGKSTEERKQMTSIFKNQVSKLQELVPELKIASAVVHYDEASPHLHIVGVPVATGYKKGLEKQVAKTKVFTSERLSELQDDMRAHAEAEMEKYEKIFGNVQLKEKEKGRNKDLPKALLSEYYSTKNEVESLKSSVEKLRKEEDLLKKSVKTLHSTASKVAKSYGKEAPLSVKELNSICSSVETPKLGNKSKVLIEKSDFERLTDTAYLVNVSEKSIREPYEAENKKIKEEYKKKNQNLEQKLKEAEEEKSKFNKAAEQYMKYKYMVDNESNIIERKVDEKINAYKQQVDKKFTAILDYIKKFAPPFLNPIQQIIDGKNDRHQNKSQNTSR